MRPALISVVIIALTPGGAEVIRAATYRVSDLETLARVVGQTAQPGDVVELRPGTYHLAVDRIPVMCSGTSEQPIVIRGVVRDGVRPVIDASRVNVRRCVFRVGPAFTMSSSRTWRSRAPRAPGSPIGEPSA